MIKIKAPTSPVDDSKVLSGTKTPKKTYSVLDGLVDGINKVNPQSIIKASETPRSTRLPTGIFELDLALGGGFPKGKYSVIYGPESSCLSGDTFIQYEIRTDEGERQNHKGGSLERLYYRFNNIPRKGKGNYQRPTTIGSHYYAPSINEEGRVIQNRILAVVKNGEKQVWKLITEKGFEIKATGDHRFLCEDKYVTVDDLAIGSVVMIHNNTPYVTDWENQPKASRPAVHVKYHPHGTHHVVNNCAYKAVIKARLHYEAVMNQLDFDTYRARLNSGHLEGLSFLDPGIHVHHLDEDFTNNEANNLEAIPAHWHGQMHALERHNNLRYMAVADKIVSKMAVGFETVYDIEMAEPYSNFVASGFVVHNCKTNIVYKAIANAQRLPPPCNAAVLVDLEGTFDKEFAVQFGIDLDRLYVVKPAYGEQAVDQISALIEAPEVALIAVDSLAVLVAAKELEGSVEKADVGTSALLIKRLCNKMAIALSECQKRNHFPAIIFINQTRYKIGVVYGDPETMPGGMTLKFNASLILRVRGKNKMVGTISGDIPAFKTVSAIIKKAKMGVVQSEFEFDMCMLEHDGLMVGDTDSFNKVKGYLQAGNHLVKNLKKGGWDLFGVNYPTLGPIQDTYRAEDSFAIKCQQVIVADHGLSMKPVEYKEPSNLPPEEETANG